MRLFFRSFGFFLAIPLLYILVVFSYNLYYLKTKVPNIPIVNTLIMGDSQTQNTVDQSYLINAVNYAKSNEPYAISFWKLKYISENLSSPIDTVILGFSHHNISSKKDLAFIDKGASIQFNRIYAVHMFSDKDSLKIDYFKYYNTLFRNFLLIPKKKHYMFQGKYAGLTGDLTKRDLYQSFSSNHYHDKFGKEFEISPTNLSYLDSIINFCRDKKIILKLIAPPVTKKYYTNIPSKFKLKFEEYKSSFISDGIIVRDFSQSIKQDSLFADFNHLNRTGSQLFMKQVYY